MISNLLGGKFLIVDRHRSGPLVADTRPVRGVTRLSSVGERGLF